MKKLVISLLLMSVATVSVVSAGIITVQDVGTTSSCNPLETKDRYYYIPSDSSITIYPDDTFGNTVDSLISRGPDTSVQIWRHGVLSNCNDWGRISNVVSASDSNGALVIRNDDGCVLSKPNYTKVNNPTAIDAQIHSTIGYRKVFEGGAYSLTSRLYYRDQGVNSWTCYPGGNTVTNSDSCPTVTVKYGEQNYHKGECLNYRVFWCGDGLVNRSDGNTYYANGSYTEECDPESPEWKNGKEGQTCNANTCKIEYDTPVCSSTYNKKTKYTSTSEHWLKSTDKLCDKGEVVEFEYTPSTGGPRTYTWNCKNGSKKTNPKCEAKQERCGDGTKNGDEECDEGSNNGKSNSTCSSTCTKVGLSCGSKDKGTTYFLTKQTSSWLKKTDTGMCGEGLTVGTPEIKGTDSHVEWTCENVNGGKKACEAYQEYCGDGKVKDGKEECDPESSDWKNRTDGVRCNASCKKERCGDGTKNGDEECDEGSNNGKSNSTCSSTCTKVGLSCGSKDKGTTYFLTKQTTPWLKKTDTGMCGEGLTLGTPEIKGTDSHVEWTCENVNGGKKTCEAYQEYCGDGKVKDGKEECDEGDNNGKSNSTCSNTCTKVGLSCGSKDKGTTYFLTKQTTPWLKKTDTGMCGEGLTLGTPEIKGTDSHVEWTCENVNGGKKTCEAYQEYCGDGDIKAGEEECDDGDNNGGNGSTCSKDCKGVSAVTCGTQDKGKTYFSSKQTTPWLKKTDIGMCGDGLTVGAPYITGTDSHVEWTCNNTNGSKKVCKAYQEYCGDGTKNESEECDDGDNNGENGSTCSKDCKGVSSVTCGTKNERTTYFSSKQTTPWLKKTDTGMCGDGLTVGAPYITGTDSHIEWTCNNTNGSKKVCKAYQEYCGDGIKDESEECDPKDPNKEGWNNNGKKCTDLCKLETLPKSNLRIKKTFTDGSKTKTVKVGDLVGYKITFGNNGNASATIVSIKDFLPKNVEYLSSEIYIIKGNNSHLLQGSEVIDTNRKVDGVYVDIYGGITLEANSEGYIILTGKVLETNKDNRINFACIYLNDNKIDCDDVIHNIEAELICTSPNIEKTKIGNGGGSTNVTCNVSPAGEKAKIIELSCGNGTRFTGENISSLNGICTYPANNATDPVSYGVVCKVNNKATEDCKSSVIVEGKEKIGTMCRKPGILEGTKTIGNTGGNVKFECKTLPEGEKAEIIELDCGNGKIFTGKNVSSLSGTCTYKSNSTTGSVVYQVACRVDNKATEECKTDVKVAGMVCGDGIINGSEECDEGANNGRSGSTCSKDCKLVTSVDCGTKNEGKTYFSSKQTTPWLKKTDAGMCGDGLTVGTPEIKGDDNHLEWTCSNINGTEKVCEAYQEYCGDGKMKEGKEECDEGDNNGKSGSSCSSTCKLVNSVSCGTKHGKTTYFSERQTTPWLSKTDAGMCGDGLIVGTPYIDGLYLKWTCSNENGTQKTCEAYQEYCGDGTKNGSEECDPKDPNQEGWIDGCSPKCITKINPPECIDNYCGIVGQGQTHGAATREEMVEIIDCAKCFNINAGNVSIETGEILPVYRNIRKIKDNEAIQSDRYAKIGDPCDSAGIIALDSMECTFEIKDGAGNIVKGPRTRNCIESLDKLEEPKGLVKGWLNWQEKTYGGYMASVNWRYGTNYTFRTNYQYIDFSDLIVEYLGEYSISLNKIELLWCDGENWVKTTPYRSVCQSNFVVTNPYTAQKTPSGNLKSSTTALDKYLLKSGELLITGSSLLNAIYTTSESAYGNLDEAMKNFIGKYEKLAVKTNVKYDFLETSKGTVSKVPGKDMYIVKGNVKIKGSKVKGPFTIIQTSGTAIIDGSVNHNIMLLTVGGNITFRGNCTSNQIVKGIFYAGGSLIREGVDKNNDTGHDYRCDKGGLHVKGVLIGKGLNELMENSRSHLEEWFNKKTANTVMDGASVLIEYSPSVFAASTMPPGAEDFTTLLSIYKN